jgi:hypothetical protein
MRCRKNYILQQRILFMHVNLLFLRWNKNCLIKKEI